MGRRRLIECRGGVYRSRQRTPPPYAGKTPTTLAYLQQYDMDSAYLAPRGRDATTQAYKKRLYMTIHTIMRAMAGDHEMRVIKKRPHINWSRVWETLSAVPVPEPTQMVWFRVIHDLILTNERLQRIRMVQTETSRKCTMKDTLEHRITACGEGRDIWEHSKSLIAQLLRAIPSRKPDDWLLHPQFQTWPPTRYRAILWTLAQVILFRTQQTRTLTLQDFMDYLQRSS